MPKVKTLKKISSEKANVWSFLSLLANFAAAYYVALSAHDQTNKAFQLMLAIVASILIVNILTMLYKLNKK